jgi:hypothetical protein
VPAAKASDPPTKLAEILKITSPSGKLCSAIPNKIKPPIFYIQ